MRRHHHAPLQVAEPRASVPDATRAARSDSWNPDLRLHDDESPVGDVGATYHLDDHRARDLLLLQQIALEAGPRGRQCLTF